MNIPSITYNLPLITPPKVNIDFLWYLTYIFCCLALLYVGITFFYRNSLTTREKKIISKKKELMPLISEFLFYTDDAKSEDDKAYFKDLTNQIKGLVVSKFNRQVLTDILIELQKDVSGETLKVLCNLYKDIGLNNDAFRKLKSRRWQILSQGIVELTHMRVVESYEQVAQYINDKRHVVRKQAEIATVSLKPDGIEYFLNNTEYRVSRWQQLKLLDIIRNIEGYKPPQFRKWLESSNVDVVLFAMRLINYYNQNDCNEKVVALLEHDSSEIKTEAITYIKEFCLFEAVASLKEVYWDCYIDNKLAILDTIGFLGSDDDIQYLKLVANKEEDFAITSRAKAAMLEINPNINTLIDVTYEEDFGVELLFTLDEDLFVPVTKNDASNKTSKLKTNHDFEIIFQDELASILDLEVPKVHEVPWEEESININAINLNDEEIIAANDEIKKLPPSIFNGMYSESDESNKLMLLNLIGEVGDTREIALLEIIVAIEKDNTIKAHAAEILKELKEAVESKLDQEIDLKSEDSTTSVFQSIYKNADYDTQIMLLEEMAEIGGEKEKVFLEQLLDDSSQKIRKKAVQAYYAIQEKINTDESNDSGNSSLNSIVESTIIDDSALINKKEPVEFYFLMEKLNVKPTTSDDFKNIDFDISEEYFEENSNSQ